MLPSGIYDRCDNIVTEVADLAAEIIPVDKVLGRCGHPKWLFKRVRDSIDRKKQEGGAKKKKKEESDRERSPQWPFPMPKEFQKP